MKTLKFASEIYWPLGTHTKLEWMELVFIESMTWENQSTKLNRIINSQVLHTERSGLKRKRRNPTCTTKYYNIQKRARFEFDFFFFLKVRNRSRCANQSQALHSRGFAHIPNSSTQVVTATQWSKSKYLTRLTWLIHPSFLPSKWNLYPNIQFFV